MQTWHRERINFVMTNAIIYICKKDGSLTGIDVRDEGGYSKPRYIENTNIQGKKIHVKSEM